jgi:UDP-glucose 4-epimerase
MFADNLVYILIGGNGFLGKGLRRTLLRENIAVVIVGRAATIITADNETYYSITEYSLNVIADKLPLNKEYIIIDLAYTSVPNTSYVDPIKDFSENLYNVLKHLDFAIKISAKRFVFVSSGGTVYGNPGDALIAETAPTFPLSPYGISKLSCERYVYLYNQVHDLPALIVRPSNVYGPGHKPFRGQGFIPTAMGLFLKHTPVEVFGDGRIVRDYLFIDDFCEALYCVIEHGNNGEIYNIGSGQGISINGIIDHINEILKPGDFLQVNYKPSRPFDVQQNVLDCSKVFGLNGWRPQIMLKEGLQQTWEWITDSI